MIKRISFIIIALTVILSAANAATLSSSALQKKVEAAEKALTDFSANMQIDSANKKNISGMGAGYSDVVKLEKAEVKYKKPNLIRIDGYAQGIKATYIQNGYSKLVLASMIRQRQNVKNDPGKRQDSLDMGFVNSQLWKDNTITVGQIDSKGIAKLTLKPKFGGKDKRHDNVWLDTKNLRLIKREKYLASGELRIKTEFKDYKNLTSTLPIATTSSMYDPDGKFLGTASYTNVKVNTGIKSSLFSLETR